MANLEGITAGKPLRTFVHVEDCANPVAGPVL